MTKSGVSSPDFPILPTVVILYLVPRFSSCGSVEDRDKLGLPQPLNSRSFFSFTLFNQDIVASAELRRCVLMPSGNNPFVVDKFSELVDTEIARPNCSRYSCVITLPVTASSRQNAQQSKSSGNSWELFYYKSKIIFTIALHFLQTSNTLNTFWWDFLWEFSEHFWLPGT